MVVTNEPGPTSCLASDWNIQMTAECLVFRRRPTTRLPLGRPASAAELHAAGGTQAQTVEVNVAADTLIATTSSSVGTVLPEYKLRDLPRRHAMRWTCHDDGGNQEAACRLENSWRQYGA